MRRIGVLGALLFLVACGGSGGGGGASAPPAPVHTTVTFGPVPSASPTSKSVVVQNPTGVGATLDLVSATGAFSIAAGMLPVFVPQSANATLDVVVSPTAAGGLSGTITLHFTGGAGGDAILDCTASAEAITLAPTTATLAFGEVPVGMKKDIAVGIKNNGSLTAGHVTGVTLPAGGFSLLTAMPLTILPGATGTVTVRYMPTVPGAPAGNVVFATDDPTGPITLPAAATSGGQEVTDLGSKTFSGGFTSSFNITIPTDAISFTVAATTSPGTTIGLGLLTGPQGQVFENESGTGAYFQFPDDEIFDAMVPNTDKAALALVPGSWTVKLRRFSGSATSANARLIVQRRPGPTTTLGTLDVNVFFSNVLSLKAATAATSFDLQDVLARVDTIFSQQGIRLGDVDYYDITDSTYDDVTNGEFAGLLKKSSVATKTRLNYFFVRTAVGGGVIGMAAKIDGPTQNGTWASGVMGIWTENPSVSSRDLIARVMAHEIGHFLGLLHTAESDGSHDAIDDTAECGSGGCSSASQLYLMHWNAGPGGAVVSNGEGLVVRGHPLVSAALPPGVVLPAFVARSAEAITPLSVEPNWCGTCRRAHPK